MSACTFHESVVARSFHPAAPAAAPFAHFTKLGKLRFSDQMAQENWGQTINQNCAVRKSKVARVVAYGTPVAGGCTLPSASTAAALTYAAGQSPATRPRASMHVLSISPAGRSACCHHPVSHTAATTRDAAATAAAPCSAWRARLSSNVAGGWAGLAVPACTAAGQGQSDRGRAEQSSTAHRLWPGRM